VRQPFLRADDKIAGLGEKSEYAIQGFDLQGRFEIGERDIAAENEIEATVRRF
jgi:hypothetical protein